MIRSLSQLAFENDELLDIVKAEEAKDAQLNEIYGYKRHPKLDAVHFDLEKSTLDFCSRRGALSYGAVMDAMDYFLKGDRFESGYFDCRFASKSFGGVFPEQIKPLITDVSEEIKNAALDSLSKRQLTSEELNKLIVDVSSKYRIFCQSGERRKWYQRNLQLTALSHTEQRHPYNIIWTPWFKKLNDIFVAEGIAAKKKCPLPQKP